jgi:hypothetical protein
MRNSPHPHGWEDRIEELKDLCNDMIDPRGADLPRLFVKLALEIIEEYEPELGWEMADLAEMVW